MVFINFQLRLDKKHVKLLSSLCGHNDFEIRAYSWSILTKLSATIRGAESVVKGKISVEIHDLLSDLCSLLLLLIFLFYKMIQIYFHKIVFRAELFARRLSCMLYKYFPRYL